MNCGMKLVKYLLFGFNLVFFIFAIALIGVGAAVEIKYREVVQVTGGTAIAAAPILLICIGVFIFFVSFFGCCGAYKESYCMVATFAILMGIIFVLEIAAAITAYVLRGKIETYLTTSFQKAITDYKPGTAEVFGGIQSTFDCCGSANFSDWNSPKYQDQAKAKAVELNITNTADILVPKSCCTIDRSNEGCGFSATRSINTVGCVPKIETLLKANIKVVGGIAIAVIVIQVVGIIFACVLMRTIKAQYEVV